MQIDLPIDVSQPFHLATIHRQENTDDPERLRSIIDAIGDLDQPVLLAVHPRLRDHAARLGLKLDVGNIVTTSPLSYPELVVALEGCSSVVTDSGGLQKEALLASRPCTTIRPETEWTETLEGSWNVLAVDPKDIAAAVSRPRPTLPPPAPYGSGDAADRVVSAIADVEAASNV